jgi:predicted nucleic acid-binding Zn ribbon protein
MGLFDRNGVMGRSAMTPARQSAEPAPQCLGCGGRNPRATEVCGWCGRPLMPDRQRTRRRAGLVAVFVVACLILAGLATASAPSVFLPR